MDRSDGLRSRLEQVLGGADPQVRLRALSDLQRELESVETELAADALHQGLSWRQIGEALGITKQAAHRRHRHGVAELDRAAETQHRGREVIVSATARQAVRVARREAATHAALSVGTEHILLGLLQSGDGPTSALLERHGVTLASARQAMEATVEMRLPGGNGIATQARPDSPAAILSPLARRVLEKALQERVERGSGSLTAGDLLLALVRHDNSGAARTLTALGVDVEALQAAAAADAP